MKKKSLSLMMALFLPQFLNAASQNLFSCVRTDPESGVKEVARVDVKKARGSRGLQADLYINDRQVLSDVRAVIRESAMPGEMTLSLLREKPGPTRADFYVSFSMKRYYGLDEETYAFRSSSTIPRVDRALRQNRDSLECDATLKQLYALSSDE